MYFRSKGGIFHVYVRSFHCYFLYKSLSLQQFFTGIMIKCPKKKQNLTFV